MKGYMASCGITAGDKRIGNALSIVSPLYQVQRNTNTARQAYPYPYHADYFGHKLHMDQNEKLAMYGLTKSVYVMAIAERLWLLQKCQ